MICSPSFVVAEHICSIMAALLKNCTGAHRQRLLNKFTESDHIKVDRLMELHFSYLNRVQVCDDRIEREKQVNLEAKCRKMYKNV